MGSQLVAQLMPFSSVQDVYFNVSQQKLPYFNVSRITESYLTGSLLLTVRLSLAPSGPLWLSQALSVSLLLSEFAYKALALLTRPLLGF